MKKLLAYLVIAACLLMVVVPVTAANENDGDRSVSIGAQGGDHSQDPAGKEKSGDAPVNTSLARETTQGARQDGRADGAEITRTTPRDTMELRNDTRKDQEQPRATYRNASPVRAGWTRNPNQVRLAVHTLLALENSTGGIGPQVSALARDFNNSASSAQQLENRIENRDIFSKLFFGGDRDAAGELANITAQNRERIRQIQQLVNTSGTDAGTEAALDEQLQVLQDEQDRLDDLATQTRQDRGLFGWMGK